MAIIQSILTKNDCYKQGKTINVQGLMLHSVGCSQPDAKTFIKKWNKSGVEKCVHGFIDANTGDIYQTLPWNMRGWHAGGAANNTHIGVEMCEPDCIKYTGGATFTVKDKDKAKAQEMVARTYMAAVELFAMLCHDYCLLPSSIVSHSEGYAKGIASGHSDPEHLWRQLDMPYTMDSFRADVSKAMSEYNNQPVSDTVYCVQVGSFKSKENAQNMLNKLRNSGFEGYIKTK